ncbi:septum formation initiator family protein [Emticicia sp. CRIBPO]|jgi:cell division protein DivIC|uniref:septum formation initiator family protein n=1 Tax=Emticicia sp. CRIBPO TaxID=2683258 RepID=UPI001412C627|nr:septum formation initiator family protein [Emticicia sp. CRIBPO]NBA88739.1 septum formation initiator family protein [Emticicia sp. CRIBPO]
MKKVLPSYFKRNQFYFYTALGFLVWLTFFDRSNLISQFNLWMDLNKLEEQKGYYEEQLRLVKIEEKEIMGNAKSLEKFAREKYLMKKEGETVFVLVDKDGNLIEEKE